MRGGAGTLSMGLGPDRDRTDCGSLSPGFFGATKFVDWSEPGPSAWIGLKRAGAQVGGECGAANAMRRLRCGWKSDAVAWQLRAELTRTRLTRSSFFMSRQRLIRRSLILVCLALVAGWFLLGKGGGCQRYRVARKKAEEERERTDAEKRRDAEKENEKPIPDFELMTVTVLPGMDSVVEASDEDDVATELEPGVSAEPNALRRVAAKPGHWVHARYETKANNFDFTGQLTVECTDRELVPIDLELSAYHSPTTRPFVLPKGQYKSAELPLFVSVPDNALNRTVQLHAELQSGSGREMHDYTPILRLKSHQYHLAVFSGNPDAYGYVSTLDSVLPPLVDGRIDLGREDFIVTLHGLGEHDAMMVPGNPLAWTSIAYVIWDDLPPDAFAPDQQSAMLDWLHWGGQLIISGPRSLDQLRASFLGDYLPASSDRSDRATPEVLKPLNDHWSIEPNETSLDRSAYRLRSSEKQPLEYTPLTPTEGSRPVPGTGGLCVERLVGRGRILVTAFSLSDRNVVNWQNYDGFFNGCLLRRPARRYRMTESGYPQLSFVNTVFKRQDARINCALRYFSRDVMIPGEGRVAVDGYADVEDSPPSRTANRQTAPETTETTETTGTTENEGGAKDLAQDASGDPEGGDVSRSLSMRKAWGANWNVGRSWESRTGDLGVLSSQFSGVAGWSDFSSASRAARRSLQEASGISVPKATFVLKVLAAYLLCLVPINWIFFRLLGRVEWAWFAAPLIAIAGALAVIRLAQLDIGFVRSRTEIAILETQPEYQRGHLTRYVGLYTSLTSSYSVGFQDSNAVGLPFSTNPTLRQLRLQKQRRRPIPFVRDNRVALEDFPVLSNSTGMVHVEQMVDLAGTVALEPGDDSLSARVRNGLEWTIRGATAVHLSEEGVYYAPLGDIGPGEQADVSLQNPGDLDPLMEQLASDSATSSETPMGEVSMRNLIRLAVHPASIPVGGWRLVGWADQSLEGLEIEPKANQSSCRLLLVCHLDHGIPQPLAVDRNHAADFQRDESTDEIDFDAGVAPNSR